MTLATTRLYLLCFAYQRYRQINDHLIEAFMVRVEDCGKQAKLVGEEAMRNALTEALPARQKALGAMLWPISSRCEPCIVFYVQQAVTRSATEAELGEVLAVASTMGGCVGEMWALKAYKAYKDFTGGQTTPQAEPSCCA